MICACRSCLCEQVVESEAEATARIAEKQRDTLYSMLMGREVVDSGDLASCADCRMDIHTCSCAACGCGVCGVIGTYRGCVACENGSHSDRPYEARKRIAKWAAEGA